MSVIRQRASSRLPLIAAAQTARTYGSGSLNCGGLRPAEETGVRFQVCNYSSGTSRWNKIEHRGKVSRRACPNISSRSKNATIAQNAT